MAVNTLDPWLPFSIRASGMYGVEENLSQELFFISNELPVSTPGDWMEACLRIIWPRCNC